MFIRGGKIEPKFQKFEDLKLGVNEVNMLKSTLSSVNKILNINALGNGSAFVKLN
jgi:hypothetical protein